jgi:hypothetical protein
VGVVVEWGVYVCASPLFSSYLSFLWFGTLLEKNPQKKLLIYLIPDIDYGQSKF